MLTWLSFSGLRLQSIIAITAFFIVFAIWFGQDRFVRDQPATVPFTDIAIEHELPLSLTMEWSMRTSEQSNISGEGFVNIGSEATEEIYLSLPLQWTKDEVRNANPTDIHKEGESLGFTRWFIPPGAQVRFRVPEVPPNIRVLNPSGVSLKIALTTVDLRTEQVETDVLLIMDEPGILW